MKIIVRIICCLPLLTAVAFATAQYPDYLVVDGKEEPIHSNPLEPFFARHPDKRPSRGVQSSALWRGYVAHFEINKGMLFVKDVRVQQWEKKNDNPTWISVIDEVFPAKVDRNLSWFTGFLILPRGKMTEYVHMGYASSYEAYRLILVRIGRVMADRVFSEQEYKEYKVLQFAAYAETERFKKEKAALETTERQPYAINADRFLFIFDASFPMDVLIDYKDFRPNKSPEPTPTAVTPRATESKSK